MQIHFSANGTTLDVYVNVYDWENGVFIDPDGWSANPNSASIVIQEQPLAVHSGTKLGTGHYKFSFAGLTEVAENSKVHVEVNGAISSVAWSEYIITVCVARVPLRPTTPGRTLDVSSGGEAGVDWSNVGNQASTVNLTGTTVKDASDVKTVSDAIKAKTDNLPTDPADQSQVEAAITATESAITTLINTLTGYVDTEVAAIKAKTDNLPTDPADQSLVEAAITSSQSALTTILNAIAGYIDTEVAAIKAKTDNLPTDPADQSQVEAAITASQSALTTLLSAIAGYVDTEVAAIKAKTDNLPTDPADQSLLEALLNAISTELAKVHKAGETRRYTQVAADDGNKTADVSLGNALP